MLSASAAVNSNTGVVPPMTGASGHRAQAHQRFHCLDLEEPPKQTVELRHELVFYVQFFVQMAEADEVTKLEQKFVGGFFLRRSFLSGGFSGCSPSRPVWPGTC